MCQPHLSYWLVFYYCPVSTSPLVYEPQSSYFQHLNIAATLLVLSFLVFSLSHRVFINNEQLSDEISDSNASVVVTIISLIQKVGWVSLQISYEELILDFSFIDWIFNGLTFYFFSGLSPIQIVDYSNNMI